MNSRFLLALIVVVLDGCSPTPSTTLSTPSPIPPSADALDWHLRYSSDAETHMMRCTVTSFVDSTDVNGQPINIEVVQEVLPAIPVALNAALLTPQLLQELSLIINQTNSQLVQSVSAAVNNTNTIYLLVSPVILKTDLYSATELSPTLQPGELRSLSEVRFFTHPDAEYSLFGDAAKIDVKLTITDETEVLETGNSYLLKFEASKTLDFNSTLGELHQVKLDLAIQPPYQNERCDDANIQSFRFEFATVAQLNRPDLAIVGQLNTIVSEDQVERWRFDLVTRLLWQLE